MRYALRNPEAPISEGQLSYLLSLIDDASQAHTRSEQRQAQHKVRPESPAEYRDRRRFELAAEYQADGRDD